MTTATEARSELIRLGAERHEARRAGAHADPTYLTELDSEIADCKLAYEMLAITEIASLRAELFGPQIG